MEEFLPILNEKFEITGSAPRSRFHYNPEVKLLHPVIHLHVLNSKNEIYLQLRPAHKLIQPGRWDTAVGGHVSYGETIEEALSRETQEEIGISSSGAVPLHSYIWETEAEKEYVHIFILQTDETPIVNKNEVEAGKFLDLSAISSKEIEELFTPNLIYEIDILREMGILK